MVYIIESSYFAIEYPNEFDEFINFCDVNKKN